MNNIDFIRFFGIALSYFLVGNLSMAISPDNNLMTIVIFSAEGIALASAILYGKRVAIPVFLGHFFLSYLNGMEWQPSLGVALIISIEVILAVILFEKFKLKKSLSSFRDMILLILIITLILQPFSALHGNFVLVFFNLIESQDYLSKAFLWFVGNSMGQLLITPMILLLYANIKKTDIYMLLMVAFSSMSLSYLFLVVYPIPNPLVLLALTIFLTLYMSYKIGVHYGAFATVIVAYVSLFLTSQGMGVFVEESPINNIINLNFYFLFQILLVLLFGTLLSDMKNQAKTFKLLVKKEVEKNKEQQFHMLQNNRLALKGEMISMIAHQWKQPLNNLSLINQMLILDYEAGECNDTSMQEFDIEATRQIQQMSQTISDFTNFFSPEIQPEKFYLKNIVMQSLNLLKPVFRKENIEFSINLKCKTDVLLQGYPNELGQTIINILNNAKDVLIERKIENRKLWVTVESIQNEIHLVIEDNGKGIPFNVIGRIFDPYFSTKSKNGTGLGLYMSKMIIEEHMNGRLLASNNEEGARFEIILPVIKSC